MMSEIRSMRNQWTKLKAQELEILQNFANYDCFINLKGILLYALLILKHKGPCFVVVGFVAC